MLTRQIKSSLIIVIMAISAYVGLGTLIFSWLEHWSLMDSFYFVTMTATTVGYGDFTPTHTLSKLITIIYSVSIIPFVLYLFTMIARIQTNRIYHKVSGIEHKQDLQQQELHHAERHLELQRRHIKEQEEELLLQGIRIKEQIRLNREHEKELIEHDKLIEANKRKIKEQVKKIQSQQDELDVVDKELEVVEEVVEDKLNS